MSFQYDFPPELLLAIFGEVEAHEDLLTLAATCRQFNHLSLQVLFSNHKFDPNSKTIILKSDGESLEMISALMMSLALRRISLEHLSFDFGCTSDPRLLLQEIRILTRYIMNLSTIDRVTLHLVTPDYPPATDWKTAYVALLDTVTEKSCSNLHVRTYPHPDDWFSTSKPPCWLKILGGRFSEAVKKPNGKSKYLKDCFIRGFPAFLRPFYLRVLKANAPVLTSLTFESIFGVMSAKDWGYLITNIHLPVLKRFAISFGIIPGDAIIKFLSKHSHLISFECHRIKYIPKPKGVPRRLEGVFSHLEQLTTTPKHILIFLPTLDLMPCLTSVTIIIIEEGHIDSSVVELALRCLSSCVKKIGLTLDGLGLRELEHIESSFGREDSFVLRCVESLHIRCREYENAANVLGEFTAWLKLFPELKQLTLNSRRLVVERNALIPVFEQVKLACPTITSISLQGEVEWTL